ncbi:MAG: 2-phospho-L-lactate transferase [Nitrososphaeraceae archaeon]
MITIIAGGTGSVKLVRGLSKCTKKLSVIVNVGDNFWWNGLYICPDIDTITYGLSNLLDKEKGWGINDDSFNFLKFMEKIGEETWFKVGDKDLVIHIVRTNLLKRGVRLAEITKFIAQKKMGITIPIVPITNDHIETRIKTDKNDMHIQDFWVKHNGKKKVKDIYYKNIKNSKSNIEAINLLKKSSLIVIAPGNPVTSIGPIIELKDFREEMIKQKNKIIAISPIIGKKVISGPAGKYMKAKKIENSAYGIAKWYSKFLDEIIIDYKDHNIVNKINELDIKTTLTNIIMKDELEEIKLSKIVLNKLNN